MHHHPGNTVCNCCQHQLMEIGSKVVREEAKFIPAKMMKEQHVDAGVNHQFFALFVVVDLRMGSFRS
ncbi:IS66 family transposase zinc-finger binding domain-containing protein [Bacillus sp. N1-1]|jgi:zinc-finger binding domain of transposase IS66|uniref:IS66 family transposase zinc-finger binding domain-containing protein n=1 Tax=Bacillus sp. N1-1 TaxID=2682541 RepID=UPI0023F4A30B|nr:IS66 family transposase zinc-finger binding domain-containing protein [Bacillus sp. N1-1]